MADQRFLSQAATRWLEPLESALRQSLLGQDDGAHDFAHVARVWQNCLAIAASQAGQIDDEILVAAAWLHDIVSLPKDAPNRHLASREAADRAVEILDSLGFPPLKLPGVRHAIEAHSFSASVEPETHEARILQDADRLDALGAIGIARTFYVGGRLGSELFDADDPRGLNRPLDDKRFALDHFSVKLFAIAETMQTQAGRRLAQGRLAAMRAFCDQLDAELGSHV